MSDYSENELVAIYELGKLYYEMGYFAPAERVFTGLAVVDDGRTPARVGLGLVKLELGSLEESSYHFRKAIQSGSYSMEAKFGLTATFIAAGDFSRAKSLLMQIQQDATADPVKKPELESLWSALNVRCS